MQPWGMMPSFRRARLPNSRRARLGSPLAQALPIALHTPARSRSGSASVTLRCLCALQR